VYFHFIIVTGSTKASSSMFTSTPNSSELPDLENPLGSDDVEEVKLTPAAQPVEVVEPTPAAQPVEVVEPTPPLKPIEPTPVAQPVGDSTSSSAQKRG